MHFALAIALALGTPPMPELCRGIDSDIEPDMRIRESDLERASAIDAADWLRDRIARGELDGDYAFGVANRMKIIHGHVLRYQASVDRARHGAQSPEAGSATDAFCTWLAEDGFWYD